ncbi:MAG: hypothetical protein WA906_09285 [Pacificimonas sp.]
MTEEQAKQRFFQLGMIRVLGMVLVIAGMQIWVKGAFGYQDEWVGKGLAVLGVALIFLVPSLLRKRWREQG